MARVFLVAPLGTASLLCIPGHMAGRAGIPRATVWNCKGRMKWLGTGRQTPPGSFKVLEGTNMCLIPESGAGEGKVIRCQEVISMKVVGKKSSERLQFRCASLHAKPCE